MRILLGIFSCMVLASISCTAVPPSNVRVRSFETRVVPNPPEALGHYTLHFRVEMNDDVLVWQGGVNEAASRTVEIVTPQRTYWVDLYLSFESTESDDDVIIIVVQTSDKEILRGKFVTEFKD